MKYALLTIVSFLLLSHNCQAIDHRGFCKKFKRKQNLYDCIDDQATSRDYLEENGYNQKVVDKCTRRSIRTDRAVTYIDYSRAYRCVRKHPNRWATKSSSSKKVFTSN